MKKAAPQDVPKDPLVIQRRPTRKKSPKAHEAFFFELGLLAVFAAELVLELFNTPGGVDELNAAGVERMARVANIDFKFRLRAARHEGVAATAGDFGFHVLRMNISFHRTISVIGSVLERRARLRSRRSYAARRLKRAL